MPLEKGRLVVIDNGGGDAQDITFMFNPQNLSFTRQSRWRSDVGVRSVGTGGNKNEEGPKVNFGGVEAYTFSLDNLIFDTYETKESVMVKYLENIKKGVATPSNLNSKPPVYLLTWGGYEYFPCVMTSLTYRLTMFMNDGMPVRALVDISLLEVDKGALSTQGQLAVNRQEADLRNKRRADNTALQQAQQQSQRANQFRQQQNRQLRQQQNRQLNNQQNGARQQNGRV